MATLYKHRGCRSLIAARATPWGSNASKDWLVRTSSGEMVRPVHGSWPSAWCPDCQTQVIGTSHWFAAPFDPSREHRVAELIKASIGILNGVP